MWGGGGGGGSISSHSAIVVKLHCMTDHSLGGCSPGLSGHILARWTAGGSCNPRLLLRYMFEEEETRVGGRGRGRGGGGGGRGSQCA